VATAGVVVSSDSPAKPVTATASVTSGNVPAIVIPSVKVPVAFPVAVNVPSAPSDSPFQTPVIPQQVVEVPKVPKVPSNLYEAPEY